MPAVPSDSKRGDGDDSSGRTASFPEQVSRTYGPDVDFAATDGFLHPADTTNMTVEAYMYLNYRNMITLGDMIQAYRLETRALIAKLQKAEDRRDRAMSQESAGTSTDEQDDDLQSDGAVSASTESGGKNKSAIGLSSEDEAATTSARSASHSAVDAGFDDTALPHSASDTPRGRSEPVIDQAIPRRTKDGI